MSRPGQPGIHRCVNLYVIRMAKENPSDPDEYRGLNLAETLEEAEDWADHLGFEGEILNMADFEQNTPEGRQQAGIRQAAERKVEAAQAREAEQRERSERLKADRQRQRGR